MIDKMKLRDLIEIQKIQQRKAAKIFGVHVSTIIRACKKYGIKTQRTGPRSGDGHPNYKGGRKLVGQYWYIYKPNHPNTTKAKYVLEHRLVMEEKLGRYLDKKEVVHHIDGNAQNNHPDNLIVFCSNGKHLNHELKGKCPKWSQDGKMRIAESLRNRYYSPEYRKTLSERAKANPRQRNSLGQFE